MTSLSALALLGAAPVQAPPELAVTGPGAVMAVPRAVQGPSVTAPAAASLGNAKPGASVTVQMGSVTVPNTVTRTWTAAVSATAFKTGGGSAAETIPAAQLSYWSGPVVTKSGAGNWNPGQPSAANAQALNTTRTTFSYTTPAATPSSVTWRPTLQVSVPSTAVAGNYQGTLTHSVA